MKYLVWLAGGVGLGLVVYLLVNGPAPAPRYATGSEDVEDAARKTAGWGAKQRVKGSGEGLLGKVKEGLGNVAGSGQLANEGVGDQIVGGVKKTVGEVAQAAGQTLHDLNI